MEHAVLTLLSARKGHFLLESGHHGDQWLDLERLCHRPDRVEPLARDLAERLVPYDVEVVCGPLVEGAFIGLMAASHLGCAFAYTERFAQSATNGLFPAGYRVPDALREGLRNKRVAIVNDVTNAGSAVKGTFADLERCGAHIVAIASLLVLGEAAGRFAEETKTPLVSLLTRPNQLWVACDCPLCAEGVPLEDVGRFNSGALGVG